MSVTHLQKLLTDNYSGKFDYSIQIEKHIMQSGDIVFHQVS